MARAREFSADIALEKAAQLFWQHGYANTSMRQLVKHTGVAHAGLYSEFGSKDDLFMCALRLYESRTFDSLFSQLEAPNASLKDIKKLFTFMSDASRHKHFQYGCFIANAAIEFGGKAGPIHDVITHAYLRQLTCFEHALKNAQAKGQISAHVNLHSAACSFTALFYGCASLIRMGASKDIIQQSIASTLHGLTMSNCA